MILTSEYHTHDKKAITTYFKVLCLIFRLNREQTHDLLDAKQEHEH
jgi:hypothetical protein